MADFSRQYAEKVGWDGYDFDAVDMVKDIKPGYYVPIICEGFGYRAIGVSEEGEPHYIFQSFETDNVGFLTFARAENMSMQEIDEFRNALNIIKQV